MFDIMGEEKPISRQQEPSIPATDTTTARQPDEASVFPDLVYKEFLAALLISIVLLVWSLGIDAPLRPEANPGSTENPAKAPWYFVGLQELLVYFDPWIAGVGIPTLIIFGLALIPYLDTTRHMTGEYTFRYRRLAVWNYLVGFALWWLLIGVGQYLRGPDWQFYWPWQSWAIAKVSKESLWSFPLWLGLPVLAVYFGAGLILPKVLWPWLYKGLGRTRYVTVMIFTLIMYAVPIKIILRLFLGVRYVLMTPWFNI
jgi:hypothetical protein